MYLYHIPTCNMVILLSAKYLQDRLMAKDGRYRAEL